MPDDDLAIEPQARVQEAGLAVAVRGLIEIHEVHVDLGPGKVPIELGVQVQKRFAQRGETANPHFGGRKSMHP